MLQHPLPIKFNSDCNKPFAGFDMVVVMSQPTCNHGSRQTVRQNIWTGMLAIPCTCAKGGFLFFFSFCGFAMAVTHCAVGYTNPAKGSDIRLLLSRNYFWQVLSSCAIHS